MAYEFFMLKVCIGHGLLGLVWQAKRHTGTQSRMATPNGQVLPQKEAAVFKTIVVSFVTGHYAILSLAWRAA